MVETARPQMVLVIGAGPSGLSAGYHLAHLGHKWRFTRPDSCPGG